MSAVRRRGYHGRRRRIRPGKKPALHLSETHFEMRQAMSSTKCELSKYQDTNGRNVLTYPGWEKKAFLFDVGRFGRTEQWVEVVFNNGSILTRLRGRAHIEGGSDTAFPLMRLGTTAPVCLPERYAAAPNFGACKFACCVRLLLFRGRPIRAWWELRPNARFAELQHRTCTSHISARRRIWWHNFVICFHSRNEHY